LAESLIPNWFFYEPSFDSVISPLLGSFAKDGSRRETLMEAGIDLSQILPTETLYQKLTAEGVDCYSYQAEQFCYSTYTRHVTRGAKLASFSNFAEGVSKLTLQLTGQAADVRSLHVLYCDSLDGVCHKYGVESDGAIKHGRSLLDQLNRALFSGSVRLPPRAAIILMADHGHVVSPSDNAVYLDVECPEILPMLRRSQDGKILAPGGANRDYFFYVVPKYIDDVVACLQRKLAGRFAVATIDSLIDAGYFLDKAIPAILRERMGDVVVLPFTGESCFWSDGGKYTLSTYSSHGGLTEAEMMIPFLVLEL
jgi:hypothetical protein